MSFVLLFLFTYINFVKGSFKILNCNLMHNVNTEENQMRPHKLGGGSKKQSATMILDTRWRK